MHQTTDVSLHPYMASYEISTNSADIVPLGEDIAARAGATVSQAIYNQMNWFTPPYYGFVGYFQVHSYAPGPPL